MAWLKQEPASGPKPDPPRPLGILHGPVVQDGPTSGQTGPPRDVLLARGPEEGKVLAQTGRDVRNHTSARRPGPVRLARVLQGALAPGRARPCRDGPVCPEAGPSQAPFF